MLTGYSFTTANDNATYNGRNPKNWNISACNDYDSTAKNGSWEKIVDVENDTVMQDVNYTKYDFTADGTELYQYYKLEITAVKSGTFMQLSEMEFAYSLCNHVWEKYETPATCTEPGYLVSMCVKCNAEEKEIAIPALGHEANGGALCARCQAPLPVKAGETYYADIQSAVDGADEGLTVTVLCDTNITDTININKNLTIDLNSFTVTQTGSGGIIKINNGKTFTLTDSSDAKTGKIKNGSASPSYGGGVYVNGFKGGKLYMNGAAVENCTSASRGGGIYVRSGADITTEGSVIRNNQALQSGGGIHFENMENKTSFLKNCSFTGNEAPAGGGIGLSEGTDLTLDNVRLIGNKATSYNGGGIKSYKCIVNVTNESEISENTAQCSGGGIYTESGTVNINSNSQMWDNTASTDSGGAVYATNSAVVTTEQCTLSQNTAFGNGEGIYALNSNVNLGSDSKINFNKAQWGGGVYIHASELISNNACINSNIAEKWGGGLIVQINGRSSNAAITESEISDNESKSNENGGGGIWVNGNKDYPVTVTLDGCNIMNNKAASGGGIHLQTDYAVLNMKNGTTVFCNTAKNSGGGIYSNSKEINVEGDPKVYQNYIADENGSWLSDSNVYLKSGKKITGSLQFVNAAPIIGVTLEDKTQDITNGIETDYSKFIFSDDKAYAVVYDTQNRTHKLAESVCITFDTPDAEYYTEHAYVPKGSVFKEPEEEPWRIGYRFLGWYKNGERYDFNEIVNTSFTLTAKWAKDGEAAIELTSDSFIVSGLKGDGIVYLASYDGKGKLIDTRCITATNNEIPIIKTLLKTEDAAQIKAFLWDDNMSPLCESASKTLN